MVNARRGVWINFILAIAGVLFSGYLTFSDLILGYCPLTESCPYLFGWPVCIYGFVMFSALLILSGLCLIGKCPEKRKKKLSYGVMVVSGIGILFSGTYSVLELYLTPCLNGACNYTLLLPSCVYGLVMYVVIFANTLFLLKNKVKNK